MSFLSDFFNNIKNKLANKKTLPEPVKINTFSTVDELEQEALEQPKSIYENPTPLAIHSNITSKQASELIYLFDMAYIAATADNSFYLPHPYKIHHSGKNAQKFEEQFKGQAAFGFYLEGCRFLLPLSLDEDRYTWALPFRVEPLSRWQ